MKDEQKRAIEEKKARREENLKRREENARKAEVVQLEKMNKQADHELIIQKAAAGA